MSTIRPDRCRSARGFALASAIFLLVVLASLGAFMVHFSTVQQASSAQDLNGSKAYQAARAGMEWGMYQALKNGACAGSTTLPALGGGLSGFAITVTCTQVLATEGTVANNVTLFQITSTATSGTSGTTHYVERKLQGLVEKP